jgi:hypothetical protein
VLDWIRGRKSDHPLDDKEGARLILDGVGGREPTVALDELSSLLDQVKTADKLAPLRAYEIVEQLDRTARPLYRKLNQSYVAETQRLTRFQQHRIWAVINGFCTQLADGYRFCLAKYEVGAVGANALRAHLPRITARALRAYAGQLKWGLLKYGPIDPHVWQGLGQLYIAARSLGTEVTTQNIYRGAAGESSAERELLKALMLAVSAPDALLPVQVDIAERLVAHCAEFFRVSSQARQSLHYTFDLSGQQPPGRLSRISGLPASTVFFGPGEAVEHVREIAHKLERDNSLPEQVKFGPEHTRERVLETLAHLIRYWSYELPERRDLRRRHVEPVSVVHEFSEVVANAGGLFLESPFVSNEEEWLVDNESKSGFGALVRKPLGQWVHVGQLIGVRRDEGVTWAVGIVRRVTSDAEGARRVGIQIVSQGGAAVTVMPIAQPVRSGAIASEGEVCVLLASSTLQAGEATLLLRPGLFVPGRPLEMRAYDKRYLLTPLALVEQGEEFEVARYKLHERHT